MYLHLSDVCIGVLAGLLRYKVDFQSMQCDEFEDDLYDIDDY
jgi:peptide chain release factor subunit 1